MDHVCSEEKEEDEEKDVRSVREIVGVFVTV